MTDYRPQQTLVRNQGDRPTCVAFAVSAAHEWMAADSTVRSAEDALWAAHQIRTIPGREETTVNWALSGLEAHRHATEDAWPYGAPKWPSARPAPALEAANRRALPTWRQLPDAAYSTITTQLESGTAVILTLGVVMAAWRLPGGMIDAEPGKKTPSNHAVLIVGNLEAPDRLIVKNSWGPRWGDGGYGFVTVRYLEHYALRAHALEST
jgi:hypothetical protein